MLQFTPDGLLTQGIHIVSWDDFYREYSFSGRRKKLLAGLKSALLNLKAANCSCIYIDGSFVTKKVEPNDYDACWHVDPFINIKLIDPVFFDFMNERAKQKAKYYGEFFPHHCIEGSSNMTFLDFFQCDKYSGKPKGIIKIELEGLV